MTKELTKKKINIVGNQSLIGSAILRQLFNTSTNSTVLNPESALRVWKNKN